MGSALITSFSQEGIHVIQDILQNLGYTLVESAKTYQESRNLSQKNTFDLHLIHSLPPHHIPMNLAKECIEQPCSQVIFVTKENFPMEMADSLRELGIITLQKPLHKGDLERYLQFLTVSQVKLRKIQQEKADLAKEILDIKLVNRAKFILISHLNMSEGEAHKYMEKEAMNTRTCKVTVAQKILKTYDF